MRRFGRVVALLALAVLGAINVRVRAQSAADFAQTAAYAAAQQNADGGFATGPGQPSTLGATNTGLRVLDYVGGSLLDEPGCIRFVTSCKVPGGGFAQRPGGKPDVVTTALGLMAAGELKIDDKAMIDAAVAYFRANTKAFEEVRMSIAGLEAVGARSPDFPRWAEQLEAMSGAACTMSPGATRCWSRHRARHCRPSRKTTGTTITQARKIITNG